MFIVIDGPNGSGKTTLIKNLSLRGHKTLSSPNGTPLAKMLRPVCRGTSPWEDVDKKIQFLSFSAARLDEYIREVHNRDEIIFADRWWTSTYVYQCMLQGLSVDFLEHTIHEKETIDLVILLDAPDDILINRVDVERGSNPEHGKCAWTRDVATMKSIMDIYRTALPEYLEKKGIPLEKINTENKQPNDLCDLVEKMSSNAKVKRMAHKYQGSLRMEGE